jgi:hypothetical protein
VVEAGRMAAPWFARLVVGAHVLVANKPALLSVDHAGHAVLKTSASDRAWSGRALSFLG